MELPKSQDRIIDRLKTRGPQSVKILSKQLAMTTMGVRQHLADLETRGASTANARRAADSRTASASVEIEQKWAQQVS